MGSFFGGIPPQWFDSATYGQPLQCIRLCNLIMLLSLPTKVSARIACSRHKRAMILWERDEATHQAAALSRRHSMKSLRPPRSGFRIFAEQRLKTMQVHTWVTLPSTSPALHSCTCMFMFALHHEPNLHLNSLVLFYHLDFMC